MVKKHAEKSDAWSGNPIIRHMFTADPSPKVWADGKVWLYCSHDQDHAQEYRTMDGYHVFSSVDLVNWTDHGEALHSRDVAWGTKEKGWMWAPDCAYKDGTYFFYFPHRDQTEEFRIGVAVGKQPGGPFRDIGHYIQGTIGIDPMCFQDDDGQAYLYFGMHQVAKLKANMIELAEPPRTINYGAKNFKEAVHVHKRNGIYYYSWGDFDDPAYQGHYAMGDNPYGPFAYKGPVNRKPPGAQDHHAIIEFRGQWYYFYHVGNYKGGGWTRRSVCVDYLYYNQDGTMKLVEQTAQGVRMVR